MLEVRGQDRPKTPRSAQGQEKAQHQTVFKTSLPVALASALRLFLESSWAFDTYLEEVF